MEGRGVVYRPKKMWDEVLCKNLKSIRPDRYIAHNFVLGELPSGDKVNMEPALRNDDETMTRENNMIQNFSRVAMQTVEGEVITLR